MATGEGERDGVGGVAGAEPAQHALAVALDRLGANAEEARRLVPAVAGGSEGEDTSLGAGEHVAGVS